MNAASPISPSILKQLDEEKCTSNHDYESTYRESMSSVEISRCPLIAILSPFTSAIAAGEISPPPIKRATSKNYFERLPNEILGEVFFLTIPVNLYGKGRPNSCRAPMSLCMVCRHWCQVIMSTPVLWSSMSVNPYSRIRPQFMVSIWLMRSLLHPLDLGFESISTYYTDLFPETENIEQEWEQRRQHKQKSKDFSHTLSLMMTQSYRWRDVHLYLTDSDAKTLLDVFGEKTPILETVKITAKSQFKPDVAKNLIAKIASLPLLRQLKWSPRVSIPLCVDLPWSRLTHVEIHCKIPLDDCIDYLSQSVQAIEFKMISTSTSASKLLTAPSSTFFLPRLQLLTLDMWVDVAPLLRRFHTPALRELRITHQCDHSGSHCDIHSIKQFICRSPLLEQFVYSDCYLPVEDANILLDSPSLTQIPRVTLSSLGLSKRLIAGKKDVSKYYY